MFYFRRCYKYCHSTELYRRYPLFQILPCSFLLIIILSRPCSHFLVQKQKGQLWQAWRAIKTGQLGLITAAELSMSDGSQSPPSLVCNKLVCSSSAAWKLLSKSCIFQSLHSYTEFTLWLLSKTHGERGPLPHTAWGLQKLSLGAHSGLAIGSGDVFVFQMQEWEAFGCQVWHYFWDRVRKKKPRPWRSQTDST